MARPSWCSSSLSQGLQICFFSPLCRSNGDTGVQPRWTLGWSQQEKCPKTLWGPLWGQGGGAEWFPPFPGAVPAVRGRLPLHLRRCLQAGGAGCHGEEHPPHPQLRHQHPHPLPLPAAFCQGGGTSPLLPPPPGGTSSTWRGWRVAKSRSRVLGVWGWHPVPQKNKTGKGRGFWGGATQKKNIFGRSVPVSTWRR